MCTCHFNNKQKTQLESHFLKVFSKYFEVFEILSESICICISNTLLKKYLYLYFKYFFGKSICICILNTFQKYFTQVCSKPFGSGYSDFNSYKGLKKNGSEKCLLLHSSELALFKATLTGSSVVWLKLWSFELSIEFTIQ